MYGLLIIELTVILLLISDNVCTKIDVLHDLINIRDEI